jgi:hypothetical protein
VVDVVRRLSHHAIQDALQARHAIQAGFELRHFGTFLLALSPRSICSGYNSETCA